MAEKLVAQKASKTRVKVKEIGFLVFIGLMALLPFALRLITGSGLNEGVTKFWQGQLIAFFIMAVFAMSYDLLIGFGGILSFGHAASFGGGAYAFGLLMKFWAPNFVKENPIVLGNTNLTMVVALLIVLLVVLAVSIAIGLLFAVTSMRLKGTYFAMLTLALSTALYIIIKSTDLHEWTGADEGLHGISLPIWLNPTQNRLTIYFITLGFLCLSYLLLRRFVNSPTGRVIIANRENEDRMRMIGYNPVTYRTIAFVVASIFAGLAGMLFAIWNMSATPTMISAVTTVNALIMTIMGGMGTLIGPIFGAAISQTIQQFFYTWFGARWPLIFGILFILIVMFLPYGIVGTWHLKKVEIRAGWKRLQKLLSVKSEPESADPGQQSPDV